jgi:DUF218 domain
MSHERKTGMRVVVVHGHRDPGRIIISRECVRRVDRAQRIPADVVIFSGAGIRGEHSEAEQMDACWQGSPDVFRILDEHATSTVENAERCSRIARNLWAVQVTIVTSWWHAPRAWWCWRRQPGIYQLRLRPACGHVRHLPGELVALWRHLRGA